MRCEVLRCPLLALSIALVLPASVDAQIQVRREWSTKGSASTPFATITGAAEARGGAIVVADQQTNVLYRVSRDGRSVQLMARTGSGPGEVRGPNLVATTPSGGVGVYDMTKRAVLLYGSDLKPVEEIRLQGFVQNPKGMAILADGSIVLSGGMFDNVFSVHHFDRNGALVRSYEKVPVTKDPTAAIRIAGGPVGVTKDGGFLFSLSAPHRITRYDAEGTARELAADPELLEPIGDDFYQFRTENGRRIRSMRWWYPQSRFVAELASGDVLNVITRRDEGDSIWEVRDPTGELRRRVAVPVAYRPWNLTGDGGVLATFIDPDTDEIVLAKLRIEGM